ncbi:unnamed protein product [Caenorhabditis bovis]|uniref:Uncharacterized protein n=1 Tax=Caenorhabditis bovis TaxID=2654633 RepID=A0A8S1F6Q8_9PELO|nr:unnamed protein product [Caenorhabditis bovis]
MRKFVLLDVRAVGCYGTARISILPYLVDEQWDRRKARTLTKVPLDAPIGWLVADLRFQKLIANQETIEFQQSLFSYLFQIDDGFRIVTNSSISHLRGELFELILTAKEESYRRVIALYLYVDPPRNQNAHFLSNNYHTTVYSTSNVGSKLVFSQPIAIRAVDLARRAYIAPVSTVVGLPFMIASNGPSAVDMAVSTPLSNFKEDRTFIVYLAAFDADGEIQSQTKITIDLKIVDEPFQKYSVNFDENIAENFTIFQIPQKNGLSRFKLVEPSRLFAVEELSGRVSTRKEIGYGRYHLQFVSSNSKKTKKVQRILLEIHVKLKHAKKNRGRRHLEDLVFEVNENEIEHNDEMKIPLMAGETIGELNTAKDLLIIEQNGQIRFRAPPNYEKTSSIIATVPINGLMNSRAQSIRINVRDIDEPPAFVNSPLPMLAVVPLNPTIGRVVFQFVARDEAGDGDADVLYNLIDVIPSGSFIVDSKSGVVRTAWNKYERGETYRVSVQAVDATPSDNSTSQVSEVAILEILADDRPPQFARQNYEVTVTEDNQIDYSVVDMKAQSFRSIEDGKTKGEITYSLEGISSDEAKWFRIDPITGIVHLTRELDYDDPALPKSHSFKVTAREDNRETKIDLKINIGDVNDNAPTFTRPLYTAQVREDIPLNQVILKVTAIDKDSGENARIDYTVDNANFTINDRGEISARVRLDADQLNERHFVYRFNVTAKDHGNPALSSTAAVHVRTENTNDEHAVFLPTSHYTAFVAEDAQGGTPVIQIQARDADRDEVTYAFVDSNNEHPTLTMNLFTIDQHTGLVKLRNGVTPADLAEAQNPINLTVQVKDDGSCCVYPSETHFSYATLLIGIEDVNNNKPEFPDCAKYSEMAKILEGTYKTNPPTIIKVEATDDDSSANGDIVYSLYYTQSESRKAFVIDRNSGVLTPSPHVVFDRETRPREDVTVKATDRGDRPLIGFCQFSVEVVDVNDNAPQFELPSYETSVSRFESVGTSVITVFAYDNDAAHNAEISYSLEPDTTAGEEHANDIQFFELVNRRSGEITLVKNIPYQKSKFVFNVVANDNGVPEAQTSVAQVILNVLDRQHKAPKWQSSPDCKALVSVVENVEMNRIILRCRAVSGDGSRSQTVYKLSTTGGHNSKVDSKFRQFNRFEDGNEWVEVAIMEPLDYEQINNYTLTLSATDVSSQVTSTKTFVVEVRDVNDVVPQFTVDLFTGTIDEELTPNEYLEKTNGKPIVTVKAIDNDSNGPQNEIHYRIVETPEGRETRYFRIDELTGEIFPNDKFDREKIDMYILTVEARDNSPSALPGTKGPNKDNVKVQIVINDVNDNPPLFEEQKYIGRVKESEGEGHDVITVKAHDLDKHSNLRYHLVGANGGRIPFGVRTDSGTIFVKEMLDFEHTDQYHLVLIASDGRHNATTNVFIHIEDVNDNAPMFEQQKYATTVVEEDVDVPRVLFNVKATDADQDEKSSKIVYRLEGQGADDVFRIGAYTGVIELMKPLDRDPPEGVPSWNFVVQAIDDDGNGLVGYADVQVNVRDINDNAPIFPERLFGFIEENREPIHDDGVYFMDVQARDFDDPTTENANIEYRIVANKLISGEPVFRIDKQTGKIFAMRSLDREIVSEREFVIEVRANDRGVPSREGFANVTIKILDMNDNAPFFEKTKYVGSVEETAPVGAAIMSFSAFDADVEAKDNVFTYQLAEENDYFYVSTDKDSTQSSVGVLRVKQPLDFEDDAQRLGFDLRIRVNDGRHNAETSAHVSVLDRNDHAPVIHGAGEHTLREDAAPGTVLGVYTTTDRDANDSASPTLAYNDLSLPFGLDQSIQKSRFATLAGVRARDIHVFVMKNISEDTPVGTVLETFKAHDPSNPMYNFSFRINRQSDPKRQFTIDQDGTLRVAHKLDREDIAVYNLIIEAYDNSNNIGRQMVAVYLQDVNDNGPEPYTVPRPCIFRENTPVNQLGTCEIRATDRDTAEYGPPFTMELAPNFKFGQYLNVVFNPNGDGGNGSMTITPLQEFDREAPVPGKILEIPLKLTDRAGKTNLASVHVIIGDVNDNPMHDGKMTIHVNSYLGRLKQTVIGRVFVDDADDWDLPDKTFSWKESRSGFELSPKGDITMEANMPPGTYTMSANCHDNARDEDAVGYITVIVNAIPQIAFDNQGAVQLLIAEDTPLQLPDDFIRADSNGQSMMDLFKQEMTAYMGGDVSIDVFSVQVGIATLQTKDVPVLNVRFNARGTTYRDAAQLNGLVSAHREDLKQRLGVDIVGVGIDMCKFTTCDAGCQTLHSADYDGIVVSANSTVVVGVNATSRDDCTCPIWRAPPACQHSVCHNDGVCHNTNPGFFCECRNDGLKGSRCQGTTRSFGGNGFAWYKPMPACTSLNISFSFMTTQSDALLYYNGPMETDSTGTQIEYSDYIFIHLRGGRVSLEVSMNGQSRSTLEVASSALNDGTWHEIAVMQEGKRVELVVDSCRYLGMGADESSCRSELYTPDDDERLNIVTPLQIGGLAPLSGQDYPPSVPRAGLNGCIRNLYVNGDQYDLATPAFEANSERGCRLWGTTCDSNSVDSLNHCVHGDCYADVQGSAAMVAKCVCDPGWGGSRCERKIEWMQFSSGGFIDYSPRIAFPEQVSDIELLFIAGKVSGAAELSYGTDSQQSYVSTNLETTNNGITASAKFDIAAGGQRSQHELRVNEVLLKENASYWLQFTRNPTRASLTIDGAYSVAQQLPRGQPFSLQVNQIMLGSQGQGKGFQGCIGTYRWSKQNLPLKKGGAMDENEESIVSIQNTGGVQEGCDLRITCADLPVGYCGGSFSCIDFWKGPFCTCPDGANAILGEDGQVVGCGATLAVSKLGISSPAIILILVSLCLLILLVLLMVVYTRRTPIPFESVRPEEMNRDNLRPYAVEGGGEADNDQYSIAGLRKPVMPLETGLGGAPPPLYPPRAPKRDDVLNSQIKDLESDQNAAPYDELRIYDDERDNISVVTLESIESAQ